MTFDKRGSIKKSRQKSKSNNQVNGQRNNPNLHLVAAATKLPHAGGRALYSGHVRTDADVFL